jgi:hypothetical protein
VTLTLDNGFLRRECSHCERQFKWHHGPTESRPADAVEPAVYFCPYCGNTARLDKWGTKEQAAYIRDMLAGPAVQMLAEELRRTFPSDPKSLIRIEFQHEQPTPPASLYEPNDMVIVLPPCHAWEPLKIAPDWREPIHCLICGARFAVG